MVLFSPPDIKGEIVARRVPGRSVFCPGRSAPGIKSASRPASASAQHQQRGEVFQSDRSGKERPRQKIQGELQTGVEKWCKAYEGRIPFRPEDFNLDKFIERDGKPNNRFYTFVFDGTTLVIWEKDGATKVFYMMTRAAAKSLNDLPHGTVPSAKMHVSRDDIIHMVKADTGVEFQLRDVQMQPTGLGSAMSGGAFVDIQPGGPETKVLSFVFGEDGNLAYYLRDPSL